jgi:hypothetical protein
VDFASDFTDRCVSFCWSVASVLLLLLMLLLMLILILNAAGRE